MEKAVPLALAASFCTATASVCQRFGGSRYATGGFDAWLVVRLPARGHHPHPDRVLRRAPVAVAGTGIATQAQGHSDQVKTGRAASFCAPSR